MNQTGTSVNSEGIISNYAVSEPSTIVFGGKIPVDVNTAYDASGFGLLPYLSPSYDNISIGTSNAVGNIYVNPNEKNLTNYQSYARYNNTWEVSYDNPTITAQLNGGDTYVSSFAQSATLYPTFYLEGNGNSSYFIRFAAITQYTPSMPPFTIGTGSIYQANATQTSKIFYNGVSNYAPNPLLQVYTYDIYDSFSSNYITILANPNWTFVSDSGYALPYDAASSELTFFNVSGAGQLQAQFLQPSQEIGQPSFVSLSGSLDGNSVSLYSGFSFQVSYTPFDSTAVEYANSSSPEFQLPFGSTASISILDQWGQIVGSYSGLVIDQSTIALTIPMSVSLVYPQFENMYPSGVNITADGHTVFIGAYLSFYIANDTSFIWTVSTYDSSVGHDVNLSGTNTTDGPSYTLIIRGPQAIASEIIYVDSYAGSQTGPLQSAPPDNVSLVVNGVPETIGDTFYGYVGERLDVQVYDVTGQLLYSGTAYMNSTGNSFTAKISDPSYTLSLKNDEQAKPGTAAATEIINVTSLSTGQSYIFPNTIGTEASLYLAAGNYTVYAHDNLTAKFNITLSSDQSYVMFGQELLTSQQFDNLTSQIYNDTSHFVIIPYSVSVNVPVNATENFLFSLETASGAQFTSSQISSLISNTTVRIGNSSVPVTLINDYPYLEASFRSPSLSGSYTLFIQGYLFSGSSVISGEYSLQFSAETSPVTSSGMHLYIDGSGAQYEMQSYTYDFILTYDNGSSLSRNATLSALSNMTAYVSGPHGIVQHLSPYYEDPGVLAAAFDVNQTGNNFSIFASTHLDDPTLIDASYSLPFSVLIPANSIITVPEDTPSQVLANTTTSYVLAMEYPNGTRITGTALSTVAASLSASLRNSASYSVSIQSSASYVYVNFTIPLAGSYTLTLTGSPAISGIVYQLVYSSQITVSPPQSVSHGISVQITVPGTIQVRNVTDATISFLVSSGSSVFVPDQGQTISIMANTSVYIMDGSSQYSRVSSVYQSPGTLYVILNISSPGSYYILVDVHNTTVSSANVSAVARSQAFVASTSNPANPTTGWDQFRNIVTGLYAQILYLVLAIGTAIFYVYRALRRKQLKLDDEENTSGLFMEAMTMFAIPIFNLFKKPVPPELQQIYDAIPARRRNKIYAMITSRRRALMPKPLMIGRKKNEKKQ